MRIPVILVILMTVLMGGCRREHDARLMQLDAVLWRNPDSVYNAANEIDSASLNRSNRAFLRLLRAEAADKSDRTDTTMATISALEGYYLQGNREKSLHPRVNYILGRIHVERKENPKALEYFRKALRNIQSNDKQSDPKLKLVIYGQLASLCSNSKLHRHGIEYAKGMVESARELNDSMLIARSELMLAFEYYGLNHHDSALNIYWRLSPYYEGISDHVEKTIFITQLSAFYKECGDYEKADSVIRRNAIAVDRTSHSSVESIISDLDLHFGRTDELERRSLDILSNSNDIYARKTAARNLARISFDRGDGKQGFKYAERFYLTADSISELEAASMVAEIDEFYSRSELAENNLELERGISGLRQNKLWMTIIILALALSLTIVIIILKSNRLKQFNKIDNLEKTLEIRKVELKNLQEERSIRIKEIESRDKELTLKNQEIESRDKELTLKNQEIESRDKELTLKNQEIENRDKELTLKNQEIESRDKELTLKNQEIESRDKELTLKNQEIEEKERLLRRITSEVNEVEFKTKFVKENILGAKESELCKLDLFIKNMDPLFYDWMKELQEKIGFNERDFNDTLLIRLKLPLKTCASILNISEDALSKQRKRMMAKVGDNRPGEKWHDYIRGFSFKSR